jgi:uncharacterized protein (UPF0335 family)
MNTGPISPQSLLSLIKQLEILEVEKSELQEQTAEIYREAKSQGIDVVVLKKVLAVRKRPEQTEKQEQMLDLYLNAISQAILELSQIGSQ